MIDEPLPWPSNEPAVYTIRAQGLISREGQEQFAGFKIEVGADKGWAVTTLTGWVRGPEALQELMKQLYARGLLVIDVEREEEE